ncbi:MAG: formate dehydrogenase accessory protein FdhE [Desulfurococcales archaeon]|nr:formate dehydrogenase accessory protein FdhE [Desulfurococcales archaeon]
MVDGAELARYAKLYGLDINIDFSEKVTAIQRKVKELIDTIGSSCPTIEEPRECIVEIYQSVKPHLDQLMKETTNLLSENNIEEEYSQLIILQAIAEWVAQKIMDSGKALVGGQGVCPVCGASTDLAILEPDGRLTMKCQFCGYEWETGIEASNIACPYCGYSGKEALSLIHSKMDDRVMVLYCGNCGRSLVIINSKRLRKLPRELYPLMRTKVENILAGLHRIASRPK